MEAMVARSHTRESIAREQTSEVLVVEDDADSADLLRATLAADGHTISIARGYRSALTSLEDNRFDAVLTDIALGDGSGVNLCRHLAQRQPDVPVVLVTGDTSLDTAIGAIRASAFDFLSKPVQIDELKYRVRRAVDHHRLLTEVRRLRRRGALLCSGDTGGSGRELIGDSAPIREVKALLERLASSDTSVLILGETGVGKELAARDLHRGGPRADEPFVAVNCTALPDTLIESELFGHVRGAFTDAKRNREGLFVRANGGTLFLDEIAELPLSMQPKLLRALQERRVIPVGGTREIPFDVRLVAATNRDLEAEVAAGRFREDLYYRINVVQLRVPSLRERSGDILFLAQHFLTRAAARSGRPVRGLAPEAAEKLLSYDWPGNVRELENAMERSVALAEFEDIRVEDLPRGIASSSHPNFFLAAEDPSALATLSQVADRYSRHVLELVDGNRTKAARVLGVGRRTLYRRLRRRAERNQNEAGVTAALTEDPPE